MKTILWYLWRCLLSAVTVPPTPSGRKGWLMIATAILLIFGDSTYFWVAPALLFLLLFDLCATGVLFRALKDKNSRIYKRARRAGEPSEYVHQTSMAIYAVCGWLLLLSTPYVEAAALAGILCVLEVYTMRRQRAVYEDGKNCMCVMCQLRRKIMQEMDEEDEKAEAKP